MSGRPRLYIGIARSLLSLIFFLLLQASSGWASGPPRVLTNLEQRKSFAVGSTVVLQCPVQSDPQSLFYEWFREGDPLDGLGGRVRVTSSGSLRIRTATIEDTGRYSCKAVNGFGAVTANITLIVLGPGMREDEVVLPTPEVSLRSAPVPGHGDSNATYTGPDPVPPWEPLVEILQRPLGGSARLRCGPDVSVKPPVTWFRNGRELSSTDTRRNKWTIAFQGLTTQDSGNYSCLFRNYSASATYVLQVVERLQSKPELTGSHPLNTTVQAGDPATFQCRIRSEIPPHIQWLKQVDTSTSQPYSGSNGGPMQEGQVIHVLGESYRVLRSTEVLERTDGTYLNKLLVPEAGPTDAGKYVCLGANSLGYSFRSAYLHVLQPKPPSYPVSWSNSLFSGPGRAGSLLIAVPVCLGVLVAMGVALALRCKRRKGQSPPAHTPPATAAAVPSCPVAQATPIQRTSGTYGQDPLVPGHRSTNGSTDTKLTWASRGAGHQTWSSGSSSLMADSVHHYPLGTDPGAYLLLRSNSPCLPPNTSLCPSEAVLQHAGGGGVVSRLYAPANLFPRLSPPPHIRDVCTGVGYKNCV